MSQIILKGLKQEFVKYYLVSSSHVLKWSAPLNPLPPWLGDFY